MAGGFTDEGPARTVDGIDVEASLEVSNPWVPLERNASSFHIGESAVPESNSTCSEREDLEFGAHSCRSVTNKRAVTTR